MNAALMVFDGSTSVTWSPPNSPVSRASVYRLAWIHYHYVNSSPTQAAIEVCAVNEEHSRLPLGFPAPEPAFRSRFAARFRSPVVVHVAVKSSR